MKTKLRAVLFTAILAFSGCQSEPEAPDESVPASRTEPVSGEDESTLTAPYTRDTKIENVMSDPVFGESGRLLFPVQSGYYNRKEK